MNRKAGIEFDFFLCNQQERRLMICDWIHHVVAKCDKYKEICWWRNVQDILYIKNS